MSIKSRPEARNNPEYDAEASLREARSRMPLQRVLEQYGHGPRNGNWKSFACPFCLNKSEKKKSAGLVERDGQSFFKCFSTSCPTGTNALEEVGYIAQVTGHSRQDSFAVYLKMAGVWKERERYKGPSGRPQGDGEEKRPKEESETNLPGDQSQLARPDQQPPGHQPGVPPPNLIPPDLSSGCAVPAIGGGLLFPENEPTEAEKQAECAAEPAPAGEELLDAPPWADEAAADAVGLTEGDAAEGDGAAQGGVESVGGAGRGRGDQGSTESHPTGDEAPELIGETAQGGDETPDLKAVPVKKGKKKSKMTVGVSVNGGPEIVAASLGEAKELLAQVVAAGGGKVIDGVFGPQAGETGTGRADGQGAARPVPRSEPEERDEISRALNVFHGRIPWLDQDAEKSWFKRGLETQTQEDYGLRSSPKSNRQVLEEMRGEFPKEILMRSGLFLPPKRGDTGGPIRPNAQLYGLGRVGKETIEVEVEGEDGETEIQEEKKDLWAWDAHPILIPYLDNEGRMIMIRPHKGQKRGGRPRLYVPRCLRTATSTATSTATGAGRERAEERFETVVLVESELKALALQQMQAWSDEPIGVAGMNGINMGKNIDVRMDLDRWMADVGARRVVVVFDNEEKGLEALPGFQPDRKRRFDSEIWARYLGISVAEKSRVRASVGRLPDSWRNAEGKADWDGALSQLLKEALR